MRILHICRQYPPCVGGAERFVSELATRLAARGHTVGVVTLDCCFTDPGRRLPPRETLEGVQVARLRYLGGPLAFFAPGALPLAREADLLHIHNTDFFLDYLALAQPLHRRPFVVSTHGGYFHTPAFRRIKTLAFHTLTRFSLSRAALVVADSAADEARFRRVCARVRRVENGVDLARFAGVQKSIETGLLLYHGRLAANKRCDLLLAMLAKLRLTRPDARLTISGRGRPGELEALRAEAGRLGVADRVTFEGEVPEARALELFSRAHLFLSASEGEAFGIALAEALATGTVPVVSDIPAHRELVAHARTGFLTGYRDPARAAEAVGEALSLPPERLAALGEAGRARVQRNAWEQVIPVLEQIYAGAARHRGS